MNQDQRDGGQWEREIIYQLAMSTVEEKRRARRWNIFFKFLFFLYLLFLLALMLPYESIETGDYREHIALVRLEGVISSADDASAENVAEGLQRAYDAKNSKGVIIEINSPGGSPVQSGRIYEAIRRLREEHPETPIVAVLGDICASGGYYVAAAADKIFADKASIVGSIGVIYNGFGFVDLLDKLGIERRVLTAGEHKAFLDPFSPVDEEGERHMQQLLEEVHQQFIDAVKAGRGDRLQKEADLFDGLVWSGEQSVSLGLVDGIGSVKSVALAEFGVDDVIDYTVQPTPFERFFESMGGEMVRLLTRLGIPSLNG